MWKKTKPSILATATKLKCTWKLPSPPLLFPSISKKLSTNFLPDSPANPALLLFLSPPESVLRIPGLLAARIWNDDAFFRSEREERRGEEEGKLRLLWASVVVFLARKRKRRRSVREYRAHFEPSTSPSSLFFYFIFWLRVSKWLTIFSLFSIATFLQCVLFFGKYWQISLLGASQSAFFFVCRNSATWRLFSRKCKNTHTKIVIFRDLLPFFEIKIIK